MAKVEQALEYAQQIDAGEIPASSYVRLACSRFIDCLKHADERGLFFDEEAAQRVLDFVQFCPHVKGPLAGKPIELEPAQVWWLSELFGWKRYTDEAAKLYGAQKKDPSTWPRRYRQAYIEVARKNAKSTTVAPVGLYCLVADGEGGAEVYSAATTRDQAKIVHSIARRMRDLSPDLKAVVGAHRENLHHLPSGSKFEPLSSDANSLDGLNISCAIVDELHAHQKRDVLEVLETATGSRAQPLILMITTAGVDKLGICYETREYITKVLNGIVEDETVFGAIYTLDDEDLKDESRVLDDESLWIKSNPLLDVSISREDLRALCRKAKESPAARANVLRKRFNVWVGASAAWLNMRKWDQCPQALSEAELVGKPCYIGLDLSTMIDMTAWLAVWDVDGVLHCHPRFYLPEESIRTHSGVYRELFDSWRKEGWLRCTDGDLIDQDIVKGDLKDLIAGHDVWRVGFDPWRCQALAAGLEADGVPVAQLAQGARTYSEVMRRLEERIAAGTIAHPRHPVLTWHMSNVVAKENSNGFITPTKEAPANKIDGAVALMMAVHSHMFSEQPEEIAYRSRGFATL